MGDPIPESMWDHHGDRTARQRVFRVFDYHDTDYWRTAGDIRLVTDDDQLVDDIERALDGYDGRCVETSSAGGLRRFRIEVNESDGA